MVSNHVTAHPSPLVKAGNGLSERVSTEFPAANLEIGRIQLLASTLSPHAAAFRHASPSKLFMRRRGVIPLLEISSGSHSLEWKQRLRLAGQDRLLQESDAPA
jgi:hypothetical protein